MLALSRGTSVEKKEKSEVLGCFLHAQLPKVEQGRQEKNFFYTGLKRGKKLVSLFLFREIFLA